MKQLLKSALVVIATCSFAFAQNSQSPLSEDDPDLRWARDLLNSAGGSSVESCVSLLQPRLKGDQDAANRLARIARYYIQQDLSTQEEISDNTIITMGLLAGTQTDIAVDIIAPYLKNPLWFERLHIADMLGSMQNPRAVPYLIAAMHEAEAKLPSASEVIENHNKEKPILPEMPPPLKEDATMDEWEVHAKAVYAAHGISESKDTDYIDGVLMFIIRALASLHTKEALAAVDASIKRMEKKYGAIEELAEFLWTLRMAKGEGVGMYRASQVNRVIQPVASLLPEGTISEASLNNVKGVIAGTHGLVYAFVSPYKGWLITLAVAFLAGIGYVFYRRKS